MIKIEYRKIIWGILTEYRDSEDMSLEKLQKLEEIGRLKLESFVSAFCF